LILTEDPQYAVANNLMGVLGIQEGNTQQAREYFEKAVKGDPKFARA
jgi:Tfp pilus assembly protein PilF